MDNIKIHLSNKLIFVIIRTKAIATKRDRSNKCLIKLICCILLQRLYLYYAPELPSVQ